MSEIPASAEDATADGLSAGPIFDSQADAELPLVATAELPIGVAATIPRAGASRLQGRLAQANAAARVASIARVTDWFPAYDVEEAAQNIDARRFMVIETGDDLLRHLGGPSSIEGLLFEHEHMWGMGGLTFSHGDVHGHQPPPDYAAYPSRQAGVGRLSSGGLARALDERWTGIINSADLRHPALSEVCLHLSRALGSRINTNIYVSYGPSKGFGAHWDNHDTIIVPLTGQKRWALFEPAVLSAERPWVGPGVSDRPLWEGVLEPGLALIIPRGWGHRVDGSDDLSIHCTIGIERLEAHQLLERVAFEAGYWPTLRADVPFDLRRPIVSYGGSVFDQPQGFARTISEVAGPELLDRAVASYRARIVRIPYSAFRDQFRAVALRDWSGLSVRLNAPVGVTVMTESEEATVFAFNNCAVQVSSESLDAFVAVADCEPWAIDDLPPIGTGTEDRRPEFARMLVMHSLASAEPSQ